ncbi:MAG: hypothetical protein U5K37_12915 [Natrialbaceae archaeon]|nr:hypothetical protein [Natrialbaceae archaeon]
MTTSSRAWSNASRTSSRNWTTSWRSRFYGSVYDLPSVRAQLNPILREILQWVREEDLTVGRVESAQRSASRAYIDFLENLDYVRVEGSRVTAGEYLQSADLNAYDREAFGRQFLGDVVKRGYYTMRDRFEFDVLVATRSTPVRTTSMPSSAARQRTRRMSMASSRRSRVSSDSVRTPSMSRANSVSSTGSMCSIFRVST